MPELTYLRFKLQFGDRLTDVVCNSDITIGELYLMSLVELQLSLHRSVFMVHNGITLGNAPLEFAKNILTAGLRNHDMIIVVMNYYPSLSSSFCHEQSVLLGSWLHEIAVELLSHAPLPSPLTRQLYSSLLRRPWTCCPITMESFTDNSMVIVLNCGHYFSDAIITWLNDYQSACPCCRREVV